MKLQKDDLLLYAITDRSWLGDSTLTEQVEKALKGGITMLQLREKNMPYEQVRQTAIELKTLCRKYSIPFIINDYVELAKEIGADGVHVGQSDTSVSRARALLGENAIIGATAKTVEQALEAQEQGADYLGSGAVFGSGTKLDAKPMEHALLQSICEAVSIPVVAIGGITRENVSALKGRGMSGIAVIGGIFGQEDLQLAASELKKIMQEI
ncbi:MAG: thiamine phosphate synthase [Lachnospiraceae bacterium]|nr:thiamine phosphate synthase [Lachnospiraceae bacterium]